MSSSSAISDVLPHPGIDQRYRSVLSDGHGCTSHQVWQVTVGNATGGTIFTPNNITASPGDVVNFIFKPKNHTVTQSSFENPCTHKDQGFESGFNPVPIGTTNNFPTFSIVVNDTNPIWVFCRQDAGTPASHCRKGMVFAINPGAAGSNNSYLAFQKAAEATATS
ncbi:hypothetical protein BGW80DRAFT_1555574 [Lactifluus volemus]|nr:hypothetical protein BGW80DRAFT_1555574 [Lactifluus volemus]